MLLLNNRNGFTLIELLVSIAIISILASIVMPYTQTIVKRQKEIELHAALREIRTAIDTFHSDWRDGVIMQNNDLVSLDGYPITLDVLVRGVIVDSGRTKKYLRRIPRNPFAPQDSERAQQWMLRGYEDAVDNEYWNGRDVYDVKVLSDGLALDGSMYREW